MTFMIWKIMRRLPKPALCVVAFFLLVAVAHT
jgi:hypothetical protein